MTLAKFGKRARKNAGTGYRCRYPLTAEQSSVSDECDHHSKEAWRIWRERTPTK